MPKLYTRAEARRRKVRFQIFAGMFDFIALMAGLAVIVLCIILLSALIRWIVSDAPLTFGTFWEILSKAIIVPK